MANNALIRVVTGKKAIPRYFTYQAVTGRFFDRLVKIHGIVEIADPELESKLSKEQLKEVYDKFPHLKPIDIKEPEPLGDVDITPKRKRKAKEDGN